MAFNNRSKSILLPSNHSGYPSGEIVNGLITPLSPPQPENISNDEQILFGNLQSTSGPKSMSFDDPEYHNTKLNRKLTTDVVSITEDWRKKYSVFARSPTFDTHTRYGTTNPISNQNGIEEEDDNDGTSARSRISVVLLDGWSTNVEIPCLKNMRRSRERSLNELAARMSWGKGRVFCDAKSSPQIPRMMLLQRSRKSKIENQISDTI